MSHIAPTRKTGRLEKNRRKFRQRSRKRWKHTTTSANLYVYNFYSIPDCKRARAELKKRSTDTLRLQKKVRKGASGDLQKRLEYGLQDVNERRQLLEETEKHAVRAALVEERSRFCAFVGFLKPVVVRIPLHSVSFFNSFIVRRRK